MRRGRGLATLAPVAFLLWPAFVLAQEHGALPRPKGPEAGPTRGQPLTPEQKEEQQKQMKAALERQIESLASSVKTFEARRDELKAMAAKDTLSIAPPPPMFLGPRGARGGQAFALRAAMLRRGGAVPEGAPPRPGTFDVPNSDDLKKSAAKALDAYTAVLPLMDEQKKSVEDQLKQAEAGAPPNPAAMRDRMLATHDLMTKLGKAQAAVGDAEADFLLLQTKGWLTVAKDKLADEQAKAAAAKALDALGQYIALKAQLDGLEQKIDQQATALQEGLGQVLPALAPVRSSHERQVPKVGPERPKQDVNPTPRGAGPM